MAWRLGLQKRSQLLPFLLRNLGLKISNSSLPNACKAYKQERYSRRERQLDFQFEIQEDARATWKRGRRLWLQCPVRPPGTGEEGGDGAELKLEPSHPWLFHGCFYRAGGQFSFLPISHQFSSCSTDYLFSLYHRIPSHTVLTPDVFLAVISKLNATLFCAETEGNGI